MIFVDSGLLASKLSMRYRLSFLLIEAWLLCLQPLISRTACCETFAEASAHVGRGSSATRQREAQRAAAEAIRTGRILLEMHLTPAQKSRSLDPELLDTVLRAEGMFDPTRVGMFGQALRMQVRSGSAFLTDLLGERWARASLDPNVHRRVDYVAKGWFNPVGNECLDFWIDRHDGGAVALDNLTPGECDRLRSDGGTGVPAPVVAAPLSLPVFTAPYPGSRLSAKQLDAYQRARIQLVQRNRWFHGPIERQATRAR